MTKSRILVLGAGLYGNHTVYGRTKVKIWPSQTEPGTVQVRRYGYILYLLYIKFEQLIALQRKKCHEHLHPWAMIGFPPLPVSGANADTIPSNEAYAPVANPIKPKRQMEPFFKSSHARGPGVEESQYVNSSKSGGNMSAKAADMTEPTSEMNRPKCGISSAMQTENRIL